MSGATVKFDEKLTTGQGEYRCYGLKFKFLMARRVGAPECVPKDDNKPTFDIAIVDEDGELIDTGGVAWRYVDGTGRPRLVVKFHDRNFLRLIGQQEFGLTLWCAKDGAKWSPIYKGTDRDSAAA